MMRNRTILGLLITVVMTVSMLGLATPAQADATNGVCAAGYRLTSYSYRYDGYDLQSEHMFRISWYQRWCYSPSKHKVGSTYFRSTPTVYSYFTLAWKYGGVVASDSYFSDRGPTGYHHTQYRQWSHVQWQMINMKHCMLKYAFCTDHYYKIGTIVYSDGSKNVISP